MKKQALLTACRELIAQDPQSAVQAICELLREQVSHYDWVGIYVIKANSLELTQYAGAATEHTHISVGDGVCGQVAASNQTKIVQDVSQESNYIACSLEVQSEIVVPIQREGKFVAEIDIDSHAAAPFSEADQQLLEGIAALIAPLI